MTDAFNADVEQNLSVQRAAILYGVPITTLKERIKDGISVDVVKSSPTPLFSQEQEATLSRHTNTMIELR